MMKLLPAKEACSWYKEIPEQEQNNSDFYIKVLVRQQGINLLFTSICFIVV